MKRAPALLILLATTATIAAGTGPDLSAWAPPDCQLVLEIQRLDEAMAPLAVSGPAPDPAILIQRLWPELRLPWAPAEWPTTGPDDWRSMSALVAIHRPAGAPADSAHGLLVVGFGTADLCQRFARQLRPPAGTAVSIRTVDDCSVYFAPESAGFLVLGAQTVAFGRGFDVAGLITTPRSRAIDTASAGPALPGFPAGSFLRLRLNLASMGLLSDDTMRAAAEQIVRELRQPAEAPDAGGASISALRNLFSRTTPEQMTAFLTGLGLDSLRDLTLTLSGDVDRMGLAMDLAIDREPGLVQDYLGGMRDRQPAAWRLLPADTLMAMDSVMDAPRLLRLLRAHARNTLGTSGETVFLGMELAAQARLGLSFSDQLLPLVGVEWGLAVVPGAPGDSPQLVGFCVPEDPALLAVVLERVAPRLPLGVTPPAPGGEPFYILNMNPQAEKPSLTYLLQTGPTVFVSDNPEALRQILAASRSGATFNPSVLQDPPAGVRRIQMLYGRTDLPGLFGRGAPASGVPFLGQTCLSDSGLSADFLMPRSALAGLVQLLPGLLARVPLSPAAEADAAPSPDAADPRP